MVELSRIALYGKTVKILIKYANFKEITESSEAVNIEQTKADAESFVNNLEELGPTFIKFGQVLATRKTMLPEVFLEELMRLQDKVSPVETSTIFKLVESELGMPISSMFKEFSPIPLSTASLGQVHKAVLRSGEEVVVKIQKPDIMRIIESDLKLMRKSVELLNDLSKEFKRYHVQGIIDDFSRNIRRELDYTEEAFNLEHISENLKEFDRIEFPKVYNSYSTSKVLTMDFMDGEKVSNISPVKFTEIDGRGIIEVLFEAYLQQILVDGFIHSDPHLGNVLITGTDRLAIIDLGMVTKIGPSLQEHLLHLLLNMSEGKAIEAANIALKLALPIKGFEDDVAQFKEKIYRLVKDEYGKPLGKIKVGESLMSIADVAAGCGLRFPEEFSSIGRTLMYLDEIAANLSPGFDPQESLRKHIVKYISASYKSNMSFKKVLADSIELKEIVEKLPNKVNTILEDIINRRLKLRVDVFDEDKMIKGFEKIANRVTCGLVISSLIIGASTLMKYDSGFTLFDYPGLAILLLSLAALGAFFLMLNVLIRDR